VWDYIRKTGRVRLARFWLRRIRRLAPAQGAMAGNETCPIGPEGAARVPIWGDSHLMRAMEERLEGGKGCLGRKCPCA
jgi:hypothetical protein